jgi:hypothetical protein
MARFSKKIGLGRDVSDQRTVPGRSRILQRHFWMWAIGGLVLIGFEFLSVPSGVGVGTSSYIAAQSVYWLGGMVLFGLGALIDTQDFSGVRPKPKDDYGDVRVSR